MSPAVKARCLIELRRGPDGVIGAPYWVRERMRRLRAQPAPTIEEVRAQWAARIDDEVVQAIRNAHIIR